MAVVRDAVPVGKSGVKLKGWTTPTPIGSFGLVVADGKVVAAGFTDDLESLHGFPTDADGVEMVSDIAGVTDRVEHYFEGDLTAIDDIPVQPSGTERKLLAWAALRNTPPGPMSYKQLAQLMVPPASARSAARACATNPVALIVPCHRFIGSDGKMHGFGWGVDKKVWLLDHEERFKK